MVEIPDPIPAGTTMEQWRLYAEAMIAHGERVKKEKPLPKHYGWIDGGLTEPSGWQFEGGEEAFDKAYTEWDRMRSMDMPNKPGYIRSNND